MSKKSGCKDEAALAMQTAARRKTRVYSVLLKKALPKKPSLSRNGATQPRTDSIVQFYYVSLLYSKLPQ